MHASHRPTISGTGPCVVRPFNHPKCHGYQPRQRMLLKPPPLPAEATATLAVSQPPAAAPAVGSAPLQPRVLPRELLGESHGQQQVVSRPAARPKHWPKPSPRLLTISPRELAHIPSMQLLLGTTRSPDRGPSGRRLARPASAPVLVTSASTPHTPPPPEASDSRSMGALTLPARLGAHEEPIRGRAPPRGQSATPLRSSQRSCNFEGSDAFACADGEQRLSAYATANSATPWKATAVNGRPLLALRPARPRDGAYYVTEYDF